MAAHPFPRLSWIPLIGLVAAMVFLAVGCAAPPAPEQSSPAEARMAQEIAESHIEGNVPDSREFERLMTRDVQEFLTRAGRGKISARCDLLRKAPTQSGVAYPKYYIWVQGFAEDGTLVTEGAMRLAAVDRQRFEVTHYLTRESIAAKPDGLDTVFPQALVATIRARAGVK